MSSVGMTPDESHRAAAVSTTSNSSGVEHHAGGNKGGIKGIAAAVHGVGEKVRGTFNQAVDDVAHDPQGSAKNSSIASAGDREMATGEFAASTKNREGALPGSDHGVRQQ